MEKFINKLYLSEIIKLIRNDEIKLIDFINLICDRIEDIDTKIQSFLPEKGRRERLLKEAKELESHWPDKSNRPPLYGLLVGVKDIFIADGFPTKCGSELPEELFSGKEAKSLTILKNSGALVLGKTVTTEFAYFEPGPTRNPYNINHTPGGSSSGSAAAVAAGLCPVAFGTQTIGSIIRPASYCGIVGFKPTYGRIPTDGVIPFSQTVDHVGFFTQEIDGAKIIASILCNNWKNNDDNKLPVIGIPEGKYLEQADPETLNIFENTISKLISAGFKVKRIQTFENIENINKFHRQIAAYDMAKVHEEWYKKYKTLYRYNTEKIILDGQAVTQDELYFALMHQTVLRDEITNIMKTSGIDLWICPSTQGDAPEGISSTGSPVMNLPWTYIGFPVISIPTGKSKRNLPLGLQLISSWMNDEFLFYCAKLIFDAI